MMKSWADHCSSDDEEDVAERTRDLLTLKDEDLAAIANEVPHGEDAYIGHEQQQQQQGGGDHHDQEQHQQSSGANAVGPKVYDFPTRPPYTAFVGNLSFQIQEARDLAHELTEIAKAELNLDLSIIDCRIMRHKGTTKHRGFAYIRVETLDQLKALMQLNDIPNLNMAGRKIQLDTAQASSSNNSDNNSRNFGSNNNDNRNFGSHNIRTPPSSSPQTEIDGSKFRGGRFATPTPPSSTNTAKRGSQHRDRGDNHNSSFPHNNSAEGGSGGGPPPQRQSLKLQPRSIKPRPASEQQPEDHDHAEAAEAGQQTTTTTPGGSSTSNIFGSGRARDEKVWVKEKEKNIRPYNNKSEPQTNVVQVQAGGAATKTKNNNDATTTAAATVTTSANKKNIIEEESLPPAVQQDSEPQAPHQRQRNTHKNSTKNSDSSKQEGRGGGGRVGIGSGGGGGGGRHRDRDRDHHGGAGGDRGGRGHAGDRGGGGHGGDHRKTGRGGGRGERGSHNNKSEPKEKKASTHPAPGATPSKHVAQPAAAATEAEKAPPKVVNKFAALMDDSDSD